MCALCALSVGTPRRTAVVITGGWCVAQKKRNIHTEDTTSHGEKIKENKKRKKKTGKKKEVPSIELANFDWIV